VRGRGILGSSVGIIRRAEARKASALAHYDC
jgi:hypothetical protein